MDLGLGRVEARTLDWMLRDESFFVNRNRSYPRFGCGSYCYHGLSLSLIGGEAGSGGAGGVRCASGRVALGVRISILVVTGEASGDALFQMEDRIRDRIFQGYAKFIGSNGTLAMHGVDNEMAQWLPEICA